MRSFVVKSFKDNYFGLGTGCFQAGEVDWMWASRGIDYSG